MSPLSACNTLIAVANISVETRERAIVQGAIPWRSIADKFRASRRVVRMHRLCIRTRDALASDVSAFGKHASVHTWRAVISNAAGLIGPKMKAALKTAGNAHAVIAPHDFVAIALGVLPFVT